MTYFLVEPCLVVSLNQSRSGSLRVRRRLVVSVFTAGLLAWLSVAHIISFEYKVKGLLDFLFLPGYILSKPSFPESDLCDGVNSPTSYLSFVPLPCVSASTFQTKYFLGGETCLGLAAVYAYSSRYVEYSVHHPDSCSHCVTVIAGNLENIKKSTFVLKEGVDYKVKITFKVRLAARGVNLAVRGAGGHFWCRSQVNKEIVSGLKYIQSSFRKGVKGETCMASSHHSFLILGL